MCRVWRQRERKRLGLHGPVNLVWPKESRGRHKAYRDEGLPTLPSFVKLAVYKGQSPFASSADRPRCKLAAQASALEESSATTSPTFITSRFPNPSVYSFSA